MHRVRERLVTRRTAVVNQIRGLLLERGLTLPKGAYVDQALPEILADAELKLSDSFRALLTQLKLELEQLYARVEEMDKVIQHRATDDEACQRLTAIPGIGPVTATALVAAIGNGAGFRKGRDLAAWVGMVPREYSTGGKQKLLGISKRGNSYLRRLFVQPGVNSAPPFPSFSRSRTVLAVQGSLRRANTAPWTAPGRSENCT